MSHITATAATPAEATPGTYRRGPALVIGAVAPALHALVMVPSYLAGDEFRIVEFVVLLAVAALISIVLLTVIGPRLGGRGAVVVAGLAVLSVPVFWTLITVPLAACASYVAAARGASGTRTTALALSGLAICLLVAMVLSSAVG